MTGHEPESSRVIYTLGGEDVHAIRDERDHLANALLSQVESNNALAGLIKRKDALNAELLAALEEAERALSAIERWAVGGRDGMVSGHRAKVLNWIGDRGDKARAAIAKAREEA